MSNHIAFIGVGNMGNPMAQQLVKAGQNVKVFDVSPDVIEIAKQSGLNVISSMEELLQGATTVISMLPEGKHVRSLYLGENGILKKISKSSLIIDCSTIDIETSNFLHNEARKNKLLSLDAPVSGGTIGAENQSLTFMVGGSEEAYKLALRLFNKMGNKSIHCGKNGSGQAVKMCNNLLLASTMSSLGEVIQIATKLQLNKEKLFDVISTSTGSCWALNNYCPIEGVGPISPADNKFKPGFSSNLMLKDLLIAYEASKGLNLELAEIVINKYQKAVKEGKGHLDFSSIVN